MDKLDKLIEKVSSQEIWVFRSDGLPPETAARTFGEALAVQTELDRRYSAYKWHVEDGPKAWNTQKPLCYWIKAELKDKI